MTQNMVLGFKIIVNLMILTAIITNWIIKKKVIKFGKIYDASVVGYKGIFRFPIVQFVCNNKTIEVPITSGTIQRPEKGEVVQIYFRDGYSDDIIMYKSISNIDKIFIIVLLIFIVESILWMT